MKVGDVVYVYGRRAVITEVLGDRWYLVKFPGAAGEVRAHECEMQSQ